MVRLNKASKGFTLIEVLLSTLIVGFIFSVIFYSVSALNLNLSFTKMRNDNQHVVLKSLSIIEQDLSSIFNRPVRDELGEYEAALILKNNDHAELLFTRSLYDDVQENTKLVRITYTFDDDRYERRLWNVIDRVQGSKYQKHYFDRQINKIRILASDDEGQWQEYWPMGLRVMLSNESSENENRNISREDILQYQLLTAPSSTTKINLPTAFKVIIEHEELGRFERVILL
jgi:general secretion pathway protein J